MGFGLLCEEVFFSTISNDSHRHSSITLGVISTDSLFNYSPSFIRLFNYIPIMCKYQIKFVLNF